MEKETTGVVQASPRLCENWDVGIVRRDSYFWGCGTARFGSFLDADLDPLSGRAALAIAGVELGKLLLPR